MDGQENGVSVHLPTKEAPWLRTLLTQVALCFFLFAAFNIGKPQIKASPLSTASDLGETSGFGPSTGFYFLSVAGGSRPIESQSRLLKQIGRVSKIFKPKFVLNIGQIGEEDPLWSNATLHPELSRMPWYTTRTSKGRGIGNFMKKIELPYEQVLEIIGVDTGPFQNEINSTDFKEQIDWLRQMLATSTSDWRIVVGFSPLVICSQQNNKGAIKLWSFFRDIFLRYRVNAYLSTSGCNSYFYSDQGTSYIGNPSPDKSHSSFLLHGVSPLEIKTYMVDSEGRVQLKYSFTQDRREAV